MNKERKDICWLVSVAFMMAVITLLVNTSLGMIQLPVTKATTVYTPAILGAILLGPLAGAILGVMFGICSMTSNTVAPTLLSFASSPFMSTIGLPGVPKAVWVSVGCRIMIGVIVGWLRILSKKVGFNGVAALPITGFIGSTINTVFVMGSIYPLLVFQYAAAKNAVINAMWGLTMVTVTASGIPEATVAAILVVVIGKVTLRFTKQP